MIKGLAVARAVAAVDAEDPAAAHTLFVVFRLGAALFGVDIRRAREIVRPREIVPVALAPEDVLGVVNLRGQIATVLDPRRILGLESAPAPGDDPPTCIILDAGDEPIGIRVDQVGDVIAVPVSRIEPPPANIGAVDIHYLLGVVRLETEILLVLDPDTLL